MRESLQTRYDAAAADAGTVRVAPAPQPVELDEAGRAELHLGRRRVRHQPPGLRRRQAVGGPPGRRGARRARSRTGPGAGRRGGERPGRPRRRPAGRTGRERREPGRAAECRVPRSAGRRRCAGHPPRRGGAVRDRVAEHRAGSACRAQGRRGAGHRAGLAGPRTSCSGPRCWSCSTSSCPRCGSRGSRHDGVGGRTRDRSGGSATGPTATPTETWAFLLPPGWARFPLGAGRGKERDAAVDEVVARALPGGPRRSRAARTPTSRRAGSCSGPRSARRSPERKGCRHQHRRRVPPDRPDRRRRRPGVDHRDRALRRGGAQPRRGRGAGAGPDPRHVRGRLTWTDVRVPRVVRTRARCAPRGRSAGQNPRVEVTYVVSRDEAVGDWLVLSFSTSCNSRDYRAAGRDAGRVLRRRYGHVPLDRSRLEPRAAAPRPEGPRIRVGDDPRIHPGGVRFMNHRPVFPTKATREDRSMA